MVDGGTCRFGTDSQSLPSSATVSQGQLVSQVVPQLIVQQLVKPGKPILSTLDRTLGYLPAGHCCLLAPASLSGAWLGHLLEHEVDFVIRLRCNHTIKRADALEQSTRRQARGHYAGLSTGAVV